MVRIFERWREDSGLLLIGPDRLNLHLLALQPKS
jgi:hypothetical protein